MFFQAIREKRIEISKVWDSKCQPLRHIVPDSPISGAQMHAIPLVLFFAEVSIVDTDQELTKNERILAAINAATQNRATVDQQVATIGTRRLDSVKVGPQ